MKDSLFTQPNLAHVDLAAIEARVNAAIRRESEEFTAEVLGTTATSNTSGSETFTYESLKAAYDQLDTACPVKEMMKAKGCDPADGWILIIPKVFSGAVGKFPPPYVRISRLVDCGLLVNPDKVGQYPTDPAELRNLWTEPTEGED